ncbi:MAG: methyltransferase domain-containing protein, partial [Verrucomicrobiota bacterium]
MNVYESNKLLNEYLLFHYGADDEILGWEFGPKSALDFAVRTVEMTFDWDRVAQSSRALDIGCAVGRSSFELSKRCHEVIGIDFSQAFVDAAEEIRSAGSLAYDRLEEGNVWTQQTAKLPPGSNPDVVSFEQGDAMNLRSDLGRFDLVHAANLLCRLTEPKKFLARLVDLVNPGGQLVLTTPCTWMEDFTPRQNWP